MDYSQKISQRLWNFHDKGELESQRENEFIDDIVQKSHIERELLASLDGIETVFDGGAGCGRFSILLAKRGIKVTHFDISEPMIVKAKELAEKAGVLENIIFVLGALEDLSAYRDREFDMVISFDAPISYTYPNQEKVIAELVRITKKRIMISVSSRLGYLPYYSNPIQKNQFVLQQDSANAWIQWCVKNREKLIDGFQFNKSRCDEIWEKGLLNEGKSEIEEYESGKTPWAITYTFLPNELKDILEQNSVKNVELAGPGAYARTIPNEILVKLMNDPEQKRDFLDFCYQFDKNSYVCGMGKDNLLAKGELK